MALATLFCCCVLFALFIAWSDTSFCWCAFGKVTLAWVFSSLLFFFLFWCDLLVYTMAAQSTKRRFAVKNLTKALAENCAQPVHHKYGGYLFYFDLYDASLRSLRLSQNWDFVSSSDARQCLFPSFLLNAVSGTDLEYNTWWSCTRPMKAMVRFWKFCSLVCKQAKKKAFPAIYLSVRAF